MLPLPGAALPKIERDPELKGTREALLRFGRGLPEHREAVEALRARGEEFGMAERPNLAKLIQERDPERTLRSWLEGYETTMRAELKQQRQAEREQRAELARQQARRPEDPRRYRRRCRWLACRLQGRPQPPWRRQPQRLPGADRAGGA